MTTATPTATVQKYIPHCSWDGQNFWIEAEYFATDFPTWEVAQDAGAFTIKLEKEATAYQRSIRRSLTIEEIEAFS